MKPKAKLYVLVFINLMVWGYIGFNIYKALRGDDDSMLLQSSAPIKKIASLEVNDSITLNLNYPDPFLKGFQSEKTPNNTSITSANGNTNNVNTQKKFVIIKTPTVAVTPAIEVKYIGFIQNNEKGTQTALVSINGKSHFASKGQVIEGVLFKEITTTEISIISEKKKLIIKKQ